MCDPGAAAKSSLSMMATGALVNAAGTFGNALSRRRTAKANARYADARARDARERGHEDEMVHRLQVGQLRGQQRAGLAAAGLDLTEGSPLAILMGTEMMADIDARSIREGAEREAFAAEMDAFNFRAEARASNPFMSAAGSLLTSAPMVADRWLQYRQSGALPPRQRKRRT